MRKARDVSVHKSGNSYALYIPKDWARAMKLRRRRVLSMIYHRGVLVVRVPGKNGASRNGAGEPQERLTTVMMAE